MKDILISVILPVYNGAPYLDEAIVSILKQTHDNFELIVINDGSTDESLEILEKYAAQDNRIIIINRQNKGLVYSLNEGILKAKGKYIARMDADDVSDISRLESQIEYIEKHNLDICGGHYLLIDDEGRINGLNVVPISHEMCTLSLLFKVPFAHPSVMIRKRFLDENSLEYGQSAYKIAEDLDLWLRMQKCGARFGNVDSVVLKYRMLGESLSKVNNAPILKETKAMLRQFYKDNHQQIALIIKNLPSVLNAEEESLLVRYIYRRVKRLDFSHVGLMKKIDKKVIFNSILSEMIR
jgi:glycosyltransferase involved in cell wall biosynthesis